MTDLQAACQYLSRFGQPEPTPQQALDYARRHQHLPDYIALTPEAEAGLRQLIAGARLELADLTDEQRQQRCTACGHQRAVHHDYHGEPSYCHDGECDCDGFQGPISLELALAAVAAEPEYPESDPVPPQMRAYLQHVVSCGNPAVLHQLMRAVVRDTKRGIADRLREYSRGQT